MNKTKLVLIAAAGILLASQVSWAASVVVGHCKSGLVSFTTIQAAVNALPTGGTVFVCPDTYPEQVEVTGLAGSNLIITGVQAGTQFAPVITSPAGGLAQNAPNFHSGGNLIAAQIWVHDNITLVNINNLTFDAANNLIDCAPSPVGILYQNATGTVTHVATRNQETPPSSNGCQSGYGILVQSSGTPSMLTVNNSTVHSFQKNGIVGQTAGATLIATGNTVLGQGPTTGAAENGIEIAFGAAGKITGNSVSDLVYSPGTATATGILLFDSGGVTITGNTVGNTQGGIALAEDGVALADTNTVTSNRVYGTHIIDGIDVCSDHNMVKSNIVNSSDQSGIHNDSACFKGQTGNTGNTISGNTVNEACAGLLTGLTPSSNTLSPNTYFNVGNTVVAGDTCGTTVFTGFARTVGGTSSRYQP
jgi:parallel beta-helix repeat protein